MRKQWKGFLAGLLMASLAFGFSNPAMAALVGKTIEVYTGVDIYIDDVKLDPTDANGNPVEAFVYNGTTYLPVRAVGEAVGKIVQWEGKTNSVYLGKHDSDAPAILLQDMDYFTGADLNTRTVVKDNLGQTRNNCIIDSQVNNTYRLNGQYRLLTGTFFQRYEERSRSCEATLEIYGDGRLLYFASMDSGIDPIDFSVDITGVLELQFKLDGSHVRYTTGVSDCGLWT